MADNSSFSDIRPSRQAKSTTKLLFCSNCGEKQSKVGQRFCSNCGSSFYHEQKHVTPKAEHEESKGYSDKPDRDLAKIGGWLLLPYIGFYLGALFAMAEILTTPSEAGDSSMKKIVLELLFAAATVASVTCIVQLHKRNRTFLTTVVILFSLEFILSIDSGLKSHNLATPIVDAIAAGLWLLYFYKSKRVSVLLSPDEKAAKRREGGSHTALAVVASIVAVIVIGCIIGAVAYANHESEASKNKLLGYSGQLQSYYSQLVSLPSSTTQTESEWNGYYSGYTSEVQAINSAANTTYGSSKLNNVNSALQTASSDLLNYLNLAKSSTDMSFQVQDDQNMVNSDKSTIQEYEGDDATYGDDLMQGEISSEQSSLSGDESTLQNDQQTYQSQKAQVTTLGAKVVSDMSALSGAASQLKG